MKSKQLVAYVLLFIVLVGGVYFVSRSNQSGQSQKSATAEIEQKNAYWQTETVDEIGLTLKHPKDLVFRKEIADDDGRIRTEGFFLTKGAESNPDYQMYGLYQ